MSSFWRPFAGWGLILSGTVVCANWPRNGGSLKSDFVWAGFPWTVAHWVSGRLILFDLFALCGDVVVGVAFVAVIAFACASARTRCRPR